jgi:hypothetical protein
LGDGPAAVACLTRARDLADAIGSRYWQSVTRGWLALAQLGPHAGPTQCGPAHAVLAEVFDPAVPPRALGLRVIWAARIELALAEGDAATALTWLDTLLAAIPEAGLSFAAVPRLARLRAEALRQAGRPLEARKLLQAARGPTQASGAVLLTARLLLDLSRLLAAEGNTAEAAQTRAEAQAAFDRLAAGLTDPHLRSTFAAAVLSWFAAADA